MSSFTINKKEYVKAAGIVAGIASIKKLWVYDYQSGRNMTKEDYYNRFVECFEMNAISVQEQYSDESPELDSEKYTDVFNLAFDYGRTTAAVEPHHLSEVIMNLRSFFSSAEYQTEKDAYMFKMKSLFNQILVELMKYMYTGPEVESWGTIDILSV